MSPRAPRDLPLAEAALAEYGLEGASLEPISVGLIHWTLLVTRAGERFVLQRLHPVFGASVHEDIATITAHVSGRGVLVPRLVPTTSGALCATRPDGLYRVLTYLDGDVHTDLVDPAYAESVGGLVAHFHEALDGFEHRFAFTRPGAHDTALHMERLRAALSAHAEHPRLHDVEAVARRIFEDFAELPGLPPLPKRVIHGDLKITNVMFERGKPRATALLDLDTMAHDTIAVEMGDALRSWCNPLGESDPRAELDLALYRAATGGYLSRAAAFLAPEEIASIPTGLETIALELAARFCADALHETYWTWDATRFASATDHHLARARSQLALSAGVRARRGEL